MGFLTRVLFVYYPCGRITNDSTLRIGQYKRDRKRVLNLAPFLLILTEAMNCANMLSPKELAISLVSRIFRVREILLFGTQGQTGINLRNLRRDRTLDVELLLRRTILWDVVFMSFTVQANSTAFALFDVFPERDTGPTSRTDTWYFRFSGFHTLEGSVAGSLR